MHFTRNLRTSTQQTPDTPRHHNASQCPPDLLRDLPSCCRRAASTLNKAPWAGAFLLTGGIRPPQAAVATVRLRQAAV